MGALGVLQILINIAFGVGLFLITMRITRQPKDDPRLSRGLQLLQAKISVLEDLSDRSEQQVTQMVALLEQKCRDVQNKINLADKHVQLIRESMDKSLEVAKIFQDKIPHQEIIERQNTKKYLKAARLAHAGKSVQEIAAEVELPLGEIEFIAKVNRDQLMFSEDQLPEWAREEAQAAAASPQQVQAKQQQLIENLEQVQNEIVSEIETEAVVRDYSAAFDVPKPPITALNKLGEEFRKAVNDSNVNFAAPNTLSFVELTPPPAEDAESAEDVQSRFFGSQDSSGFEMSDYSMEEEPQPQPQQPAIARALTQQAASIQKTAAQVAQTQPAINPNSAIAAANAQARAQMMPSPGSPAPQASAAPVQRPVQRPTQAQTQSPQALALAQARAAAQEMRKPQPRSSVNPQGAEVKKVQFPRIKATDNLG